MNRHMTFVSKQCTWHQTIQVDEWHPCLFHMNLQKVDFAYDYYCQIMAHEVCDVEVKALCISPLHYAHSLPCAFQKMWTPIEPLNLL